MIVGFYLMAFAAALVHGQSIESCLQDPVIAARVSKATDKYIEELKTSFKPINDKFLRTVIAEAGQGTTSKNSAAPKTKAGEGSTPKGFEKVGQSLEDEQESWTVSPDIVPPGFSSSSSTKQPTNSGTVTFGKRETEAEPASSRSIKSIQKELMQQQEKQLSEHAEDATKVFAKLACGPQLKGSALRKAVKDTRTQLKAAWDKVGHMSLPSAMATESGTVSNKKRDEIPVSKQMMPSASNSGLNAANGVGMQGGTGGQFNSFGASSLAQQQQSSSFATGGQQMTPFSVANNGLNPSWSTPNIQLPQPIPVGGQQSSISSGAQANQGLPTQGSGSGWPQQQQQLGGMQQQAGMQQPFMQQQPQQQQSAEPQQLQQFTQQQQQQPRRRRQRVQASQIVPQQGQQWPAQPQQMVPQQGTQWSAQPQQTLQQQPAAGPRLQAGQISQQQPFGISSTSRMLGSQAQVQQPGFGSQGGMVSQITQAAQQAEFAATANIQAGPQGSMATGQQQQLQRQSPLPSSSSGFFPENPNGAFPPTNAVVQSSNRIQKRQGFMAGLKGFFGGGAKTAGNAVKSSGKGVARSVKLTPAGLSLTAYYAQLIDTHRGVAFLTILSGVVFAAIVGALVIGKSGESASMSSLKDE